MKHNPNKQSSVFCAGFRSKALSLILVLTLSHTYAQNSYYQSILQYDNYIYKPSIHSMWIYKTGWEMSYPVIHLNSSESLTLRFDDLDEYANTYQYTLIHCNADWTPSGLSENEYMDGFGNADISQYTYSFNTHTPYVHFELTLPNNDIKPRISGNYILLVYENYDAEAYVLTARFTVVETQVEVVADVKRPTLAMYMDQGHEVDFVINHANYAIPDPFSSLKVHILQNNRLDNAITNLKPAFVRPGKLVYDYQEENVFEAGYEFMYFDCKSVRYTSDRVRQIYFANNHYIFDLIPDEQNRFGSYQYHQDINGRFAIQIQEANDNHYEADYIQANFTLPAAYPFPDGNLYIVGAFTQWQCTDANRMGYNFDTHQYEASLLVKQGYYNYQIGFQQGAKPLINTSLIHGTFYQTEDDYLIYVYYRGFGDRYDRLIGFTVANSMGEN